MNGHETISKMNGHETIILFNPISRMNGASSWSKQKIITINKHTTNYQTTPIINNTSNN